MTSFNLHAGFQINRADEQSVFPILELSLFLQFQQHAMFSLCWGFDLLHVNLSARNVCTTPDYLCLLVKQTL